MYCLRIEVLFLKYEELLKPWELEDLAPLTHTNRMRVIRTLASRSRRQVLSQRFRFRWIRIGPSFAGVSPQGRCKQICSHLCPTHSHRRFSHAPTVIRME